jgi:uncharacterized protein (TIRG00374 family)
MSYKKKYLSIPIKILISSTLLVWLFLRIDLEQFFEIGKQLPLWKVFILTAFFLATLFLGSWRWKVVLLCQSLHQSIFRGIYLYLVGYFYNNFLPTAIGGDLIRGLEASKNLGSKTKVFTSILVERFLGLLAALTIALVFLPVSNLPMELVLIVLVLNIGAWITALFFILIKPGIFWDKYSVFITERIRIKISNLIELALTYRKNLDGLVKGFLVSVLYQASLIIVVWLSAMTLKVYEISIDSFFVFVPIVWIISLIPISLNALGVREVSFAYFFKLLGESEEKGLMVSLLFFGIMLIVGAIGGILWGISRPRNMARNTSHSENSGGTN